MHDGALKSETNSVTCFRQVGGLVAPLRLYVDLDPIRAGHVMNMKDENQSETALGQVDTGERQLLNDKNKTDPGSLGESLDPLYQSVNHTWRTDPQTQQPQHTLTSLTHHTTSTGRFTSSKETFYEKISKDLEVIKLSLQEMEDKMLDICGGLLIGGFDQSYLDEICDSCWKDFGTLDAELFKSALETAIWSENLIGSRTDEEEEPTKLMDGND
ncbi:hypothetical protein CLF_101715 [Clonorchis sinensis]|uniref:Uncharacterized protein n=1 Tax=Clonorchis sinensis TaxID=79923 RepID=G7Y6E1_CLOSI|nr:hypothetical protein CLF_101715 [Clonorchis sinensis]